MRLKKLLGEVMRKDNKLLLLKLVLAAVVVIMIFQVRYAQVGGVPEILGFRYSDLTDKVMAPLFALLAATLLFVGLIPNRMDKLDDAQWVDLILRVAIAITTFLAGWHWLQDATDQKAWHYLRLVLAMGCITAVALSPYLVGWWVGYKRRRNGEPNLPDPMDAEEPPS